MTRKKRVLICDDSLQQFENLRAICEKAGYDVAHSLHPRSVAEDIERAAPIHLLILDLQFDNSYVGHKSIPKLAIEFPDLKIIIYSQLMVDKDRLEDAAKVFNEVRPFPNVVALLGPLNKVDEIREAIDRVLVSRSWLHDGQLWLLHVSDTQFGGSGTLGGPGYLADCISKASERFVEDSPHDGEGTARRYPGIAVLTGDLTQRGRPDEFAEGAEFVKTICIKAERLRPDLRGVMPGMNAIVVPGNHDVNWDVLRAQNIHRLGEAEARSRGVDCEFRASEAGRREDLAFIRELGWDPFVRFYSTLFGHAGTWSWEPGYCIQCLKEELGVIFVCLNSSRWGVDHLGQSASVPRVVWRQIRGQLEKLDGECSALRVLIVHHSLDVSTKPENRLRLPDAEDEVKQLAEELVEECRFALVLTGHLHDQCVSQIDTGTRDRKLVHVGAGTARSSDLGPFRQPEFNILKLEASAESCKFERLTIYPFVWTGSIFAQKMAFDAGRRAFASFPLEY